MSIDQSPTTPDDAELLRRSRRSATAFRMFYDRHAARIHAFFLRRTGDPDAAFELTAETFAQAWISRERFVDRGDGAPPWLFGIARNVIAGSVREHTVRRGARRRIGLEAAALVPADDRWLDGLDGELADALAALPEGQRRALEIRILEDADYAEVAGRLSISPGAARVRVHRALAVLRTSLARRAPTPAIGASRPHEIDGETR